LRRTRDAFKVNKSETDPTKMKSLVEEAEKNLAMLQRQVNMFVINSYLKPLVLVYCLICISFILTDGTLWHLD